MESSKLAIKFFFADPSALPANAVIPMFHLWIQGRAVPDHLLIDVADYAHVPNGPGTVLVSSEANIYLDRGQGRLGLLYVRKQPLPGPFAERLRAVFRAALEVGALLEDHPTFEGKVKFRTDDILFRINDRLLAPDTVETFEEIEPDLAVVLKEMFAEAAVTLDYQPSASKLFEVKIETGGSADVNGLLARLAPAVA